MRSGILGLVCAAFLAGCELLYPKTVSSNDPDGRFAFMKNFAPDRMAPDLGRAEVQVALSVEPGMSLQEAKAKLDASGYACVESSTSAGEKYLACRWPGNNSADEHKDQTVMVLVHFRDGTVTDCEIK
jgi:hypothetical protein